MSKHIFALIRDQSKDFTQVPLVEPMSLLNLLRKHREEITPRSVNNPKTDALSQNPPHQGQNLPLQSTFHFLHAVVAPNITRIWDRAEGNGFQTVILGRVL